MGNDAKKTELTPGTLETLILKTQEVADFERVPEAVVRAAQPT